MRLIRVILFCVLLLAGCCPKIMPSHDDNVNHKDSTSVNIEIRDSLIFVPIPLEKDQVIAHLGDTSRLETSIAKSEAFIGEDGFLHHMLENKSKETLPVVVPFKTKTIFNGVTHTEMHTITNYVEVEKKLTWWQKFRMNAFPWLILSVILLLVWIFSTVRKRMVL